MVGWYRTDWEEARYQPTVATVDDGDLVDPGVHACRVDRSIRIAVSSDMDIPMTYASLN